MTIAIDLRSLLSGKTSGVEVYVTQTVQHMLLANKDTQYILWINAKSTPENRGKIEAIFRQFSQPAHSKAPALLKVTTHIPNRLLNATLMWFKWPKLDKLIEKNCRKRPQIVWIPDLRPAATKQARMALTVHDLAFLHYPQFFSFKTKLWYAAIQPKKLIQRFHAVFCVSKATQKDLKESYGITRNVTVIYPGVSKEMHQSPLSDQTREKYGLPARYFLFLATLEPRKNLQNLIEGFKKFLEENRANAGANANTDTEKIQLVLAGSSNRSVFAGKERTLQKELKALRKNIVLPGFIAEEDKAQLFSGAEAFLYPSFLEGFGLPLVEAMKCETPIITSHQSSMPEITQDAAILIDPEKPQEIAAAMKKVLAPKTRQELQEKMRRRAQFFSWEKTAQEASSSLTSLKELM